MRYLCPTSLFFSPACLHLSFVSFCGEFNVDLVAVVAVVVINETSVISFEVDRSLANSKCNSKQVKIARFRSPWAKYFYTIFRFCLLASELFSKCVRLGWCFFFLSSFFALLLLFLLNTLYILCLWLVCCCSRARMLRIHFNWPSGIEQHSTL